MAYYRNNLEGSFTLFEAAQAHGIAQLVYSSSCTLFGAPGELPVSEDTPERPVGQDGRSKFIVERMLLSLDRLGLRSIALRYPEAQGADPNYPAAAGPDAATQLIPALFGAALGLRGPVTLPAAGAEAKADPLFYSVLHVSDIADAHVRALNALRGGAASGAYNLGTRGFSQDEIIAAVERVTGLAVPVSFGDGVQREGANLVCDGAKACQELGWEPKAAGLSAMIGAAWAWHQRQAAARPAALAG